MTWRIWGSDLCFRRETQIAFDNKSQHEIDRSAKYFDSLRLFAKCDPVFSYFDEPKLCHSELNVNIGISIVNGIALNLFLSQ